MASNQEVKKINFGKKDAGDEAREDDKSRSPRRPEKSADELEAEGGEEVEADGGEEDEDLADEPQTTGDTAAMLAKWREDSKKQLIKNMTDMIPQLVESHIMTLLEPMKSDLEDIRKRQLVSDKTMVRISKEVSAMRISGQSSQDQMTKMNEKLDALSARMERISMAQSGSSQDAPHAPPKSAGGANTDQHGEADVETIALVFFPMEVGNTMLKTHYMQVLSKFATDEARARAKPRIGQLADTFVIRFARPSHAEDVVAAFKLEGYSVKNPATGEVFALDANVAGPKKAPSARGQCNSVIFRVMENKYGKNNIKQKHAEEDAANWTRMSVSDADGWVQHALTVHYGVREGRVQPDSSAAQRCMVRRSCSRCCARRLASARRARPRDQVHFWRCCRVRGDGPRSMGIEMDVPALPLLISFFFPCTEFGFAASDERQRAERARRRPERRGRLPATATRGGSRASRLCALALRCVFASVRRCPHHDLEHGPALGRLVLLAGGSRSQAPQAPGPFGAERCCAHPGDARCGS